MWGWPNLVQTPSTLETLVVETVTVISRSGLLLFLCLETHWGRLLLLVHLEALPSVCLSWNDQLARMVVLHLGTLDNKILALTPALSEEIYLLDFDLFLWYSS